jgi:hypothetical protein
LGDLSLKNLQLFWTRGQNINQSALAQSQEANVATLCPSRRDRLPGSSTFTRLIRIFKVSASSPHYIRHPGIHASFQDEFRPLCPVWLCHSEDRCAVLKKQIRSYGFIPSSSTASHQIHLRVARGHRPLRPQNSTTRPRQGRLPPQGPSALIQVSYSSSDNAPRSLPVALDNPLLGACACASA